MRRSRQLDGQSPRGKRRTIFDFNYFRRECVPGATLYSNCTTVVRSWSVVWLEIPVYIIKPANQYLICRWKRRQLLFYNQSLISFRLANSSSPLFFAPRIIDPNSLSNWTWCLWFTAGDTLGFHVSVLPPFPHLTYFITEWPRFPEDCTVPTYTRRGGGGGRKKSESLYPRKWNTFVTRRRGSRFLLKYFFFFFKYFIKFPSISSPSNSSLYFVRVWVISVIYTFLFLLLRGFHRNILLFSNLRVDEISPSWRRVDCEDLSVWYYGSRFYFW